MTRNIINLIVTFFISAVLSLFLPWWSVMIAAFITSLLFPLKKASVFFIPFLAILMYWGFCSFMLSSTNDFILAKKVSELLMIGDNPYLLVLVAGATGGIAGGISGVLGKQFIGIK